MGVRGRALLCLFTVVQSRAFMVAPPARRGPPGGACRSAAASRSSAASPLMAYDVKYSPNRWKDEGDIVPGFGGIWPGDPDAETYHVSGNPARVTYRCRLLAPALSPRRVLNGCYVREANAANTSMERRYAIDNTALARQRRRGETKSEIKAGRAHTKHT